MNIVEKIMQESIEEMKKNVPEDVCKDIEELSDLEAGLIMKLHTVEEVDLGAVNRINELKRKLYHKKADELSEREPFDFGEAIRRVKGGARVARKGWNGPGQYIQIATEISYLTKRNGADVDGFARHKDIGSAAIVFSGTRGTQIGWLASQADMLADDWYEVDKVKKEAEKDA